MIKRFLAELCGFLAAIAVADAQSLYFIAANGDDSRTPVEARNQATPWQSIDRLNSANLVPGDSAAFRRGDVFRGEVAARNGVSYGAWGNGIAPIISGAEPIVGWTVHSGSIFRASVPFEVRSLYVGRERMIPARHPNTGFFYSSSVSGSTGLTCQELSEPAGHWTDARVVIAPLQWIYEWRTIAGFGNGSLSFTQPLQYGFEDPERAFFIDGSLKALDAEREWHWESGTLYFYAPGGVDPDRLGMEGVRHGYGFRGTGTQRNIAIRDLQIEKQFGAGVSLLQNSGAGGHVIENNSFHGQEEAGIYLGGDHVAIVGNDFEGIGGRAIAAFDLVDSTIARNTMVDIGMEPGRGFSGTHGCVGILVAYAGSSRVHIHHNTLENIGYAGILFFGDRHLVERNIVRAPMQILGDGAGIYTWGGAEYISHGHTIRQNVVSGGRGLANGRDQGIVHGIY